MLIVHCNCIPIFAFKNECAFICDTMFFSETRFVEIQETLCSDSKDVRQSLNISFTQFMMKKFKKR